MALRDLNIPIFEIPGFKTFVESLEWDSLTKRVALELHDQGFSCLRFPDEQFDEVADRIKASLASRFDLKDWENRVREQGGLRIQDAWMLSADVRRLAVNETILKLLSQIFGRQAWPFQTLNFPVGTQQPCHSDTVHFHSVPEKFMCGAWVALEDIDEECGPLVYYPGSHKWPVLNNDNLGFDISANPFAITQEVYHNSWNELIKATGAKPQTFCAKKGDVLIWAANLLHGGSKQMNLSRTRWSQVTHYFFEDCEYYTPMNSSPLKGQVYWRNQILDVRTGKPFQAHRPLKNPFGDGLPSNFDPQLYLQFNPDVALAKVDPIQHYLHHGRQEGRRYL